MQTIEYRDVVDKTEWGPGPWQDEPDKKQWQDAATALPCLIVRGPSGSLCGYVGLPASHRYYGSEYDHVEVDVHWAEADSVDAIRRRTSRAKLLREAAAALSRAEAEREFRGTRIAVALFAMRRGDSDKAIAVLEACLSRASHEQD